MIIHGTSGNNEKICLQHLLQGGDMKKLIPVIIAVVILAAALICCYMQDDGSGIDTIGLSGNIEVTDIRLSFKIPGKLETILVEEGTSVAMGQLVARLESSDQELALKQARAGVDYARAMLDELESGSREQEIARAHSEMERAMAGLETARAQLKLASSDQKRFRELYNQGGISLREYEGYQTRHEIAENAFREAHARLESARQYVSLIEEGARTEKIEQGRSQLAIAEESLKKAELQMEYTKLYSPADAVVLSTSAEPGEYLTPGSPVMTVGDLGRPWLRAYINETDLSRVRLGQVADVTADTWPDKVYKGRISFISSEAEFTPKAVQTHEERVKLVYRIKILLENPEQELKPGMPADARIRLEK